MFDCFFEKYCGYKEESATTLSDNLLLIKNKIRATKYPTLFVLSMIVAIFLLIFIFVEKLFLNKVNIYAVLALAISLTYYVFSIPSSLQVRLASGMNGNEALRNIEAEYWEREIKLFEETCDDFNWDKNDTAKWLIQEIDEIEKLHNRDVKLRDYLKNYCIVLVFPTLLSFMNMYINIINNNRDISEQLNNFSMISAITLYALCILFSIGLWPKNESKKEHNLRNLKEVAIFYLYHEGKENYTEKAKENKREERLIIAGK